MWTPSYWFPEYRRYRTFAAAGIVSTVFAGLMFIGLSLHPQALAEPPAAKQTEDSGEHLVTVSTVSLHPRTASPGTFGREMSSDRISTPLESRSEIDGLGSNFVSLVTSVEQPALEQPNRDLSKIQDVRDVQLRLSALGYFSIPATGMWGPISRRALQSFKAANALPGDNIWDRQTEAKLFSADNKEAAGFIGVWGTDPSACHPNRNSSGLFPAVIKEDGAWAGEVSCAFSNKKQVGNEWNFAATCTNPQSRWTSNVRLAVSGNRLNWSSERGTQHYVRCGSGLATVALQTNP